MYPERRGHARQPAIGPWFVVALILGLVACCPPMADSPLKVKGCRRCHAVTLDTAHDLDCVTCHRGAPAGRTACEAHKGMIVHPAHPDHMDDACGPCHAREVAKARASSHFTLEGEIGAVWTGFFPGDAIPAATALPVEAHPSTPRGLVADLLRRRCLRCHVYDSGDSYPGVRHGTGCAACHLGLKAGASLNHRFSRAVPDERCLSCHYGSFVGWDYYGRFEKDYEADYRAPLSRGGLPPRPYGVEWHEMTPDCHRLAGIECTVCHRLGPCQGGAAVSCVDCHRKGGRDVRPGLVMEPSRAGHRSEDWGRVRCAACHAVWSTEDRGRSLVRQDAPDFEFWGFLAVQGSSEVEEAVPKNVARPEASRMRPTMRDGLGGEPGLGLWFEGFTERRWGPVRLGPDEQGRLSVLRPILDLSLSYVDADGEVRFDNLRPPVIGEASTPPTRAYSPHTIGPADTFRALAVERWLLAGEGGPTPH